jgi:hypothetical protein
MRYYITDKIAAAKALKQAIELDNLSGLQESMDADFFDARLDLRAGLISQRLFNQIAEVRDYLLNAIKAARYTITH